MNAVAYMRCSSKGAVNGDTFERQGETIREYVKTQGWASLAEYREEGVPGKKDSYDRPAFQRMLVDMRATGCTTVVIERLDRLAREYRIQESLIITLASEGFTLISADTAEDVTSAMMGDPMRRALVQIQGILAELDKNMTIAKLTKARQRIRASGKKCEGRKCFGDRPGEDATLRKIQELASLGNAPENIASFLNTQRYPTRYNKRWHSGTVSKILARQNIVRENTQVEAG